jgi:hypothetical protein
MNTPDLINPRNIPGVGKLIFQFRKFQLGQVALIVRMFNQAFAGKSKEERAAGRRLMAYVLGHHAVMAGALGIPLIDVMGMAMSQIADDDEPWDTERTMREGLRELGASAEVVDLLVHGVPGGIAPLTSKIGLGMAFSPVAFREVAFDSKEAYQETAFGLLGPTFGGIAPNTAEALGAIHRGDLYKGFERLLPTGFRNASKGVRYSLEGETNRRGDQVLSPDEILWWEALLQATGLPPAKMHDRWYIQGQSFKLKEFYQGKTATLKKQYIDAATKADHRKRRELERTWRDLQAARVRHGFPEQTVDSLRKAVQEARKREAKTYRGVPYDTGTEQVVRRLADQT